MPSVLSTECSISPLIWRAWAVLRSRPSMSWCMKTWPVYMYWTRLDMSSYWMLGSSTTCSELGVAWKQTKHIRSDHVNCQYCGMVPESSIFFVLPCRPQPQLGEKMIALSSHDLTLENFCLSHFLFLLFYLRFVKIKLIEAKYERQDEV